MTIDVDVDGLDELALLDEGLRRVDGRHSEATVEVNETEGNRVTPQPRRMVDSPIDVENIPDHISVDDVPYHITVDDIPRHISVENVPREIDVNDDGGGRIGDLLGSADDVLTDIDTSDIFTDEGTLTPTISTASADQFIPSVDDGTPSTATADGGEDEDTDRLRLDGLLRIGQRMFGEAIDEEGVVNRADRIRAPSQLLDGDISEYIDFDEAIEATLDDNSRITINTLENLDANGRTGFRAFAELDREGMTRLPQRQSRIGAMLPDRITEGWGDVAEGFENFDATTLNNLYASFVPLMVTFIGALPAAIAGLGALAGAALAVTAAFGAVGAIGALGVVIAEDQSLGDVAEELRQSFLDSFAPIGEALRPTFMEAVDSVDDFLDRLGQRANALRTFSHETLDALDAVEAFTLGGLANLITLAELAHPLIEGLFGQFGDVSFTQVLAGVLADTIGLLSILGAAIWNLLPTIYRLSHGFLIVVTGILTFFSAVGGLLNRVPMATEMLGVLTASLLTFITVVSLAITVQKLYNASLADGALGAISAKIGAIKAHITALLGEATATSIATAATWAYYAALTAVIGLVTFGVGSAILSLANGFNSLGGEIGKATSELRKFSKQQDAMSGFNSGFGATAGGGSAYVNYNDNSQTTIQAPDRETGTAVAEKMSYRDNKWSQHTA